MAAALEPGAFPLSPTDLPLYWRLMEDNPHSCVRSSRLLISFLGIRVIWRGCRNLHERLLNRWLLMSPSTQPTITGCRGNHTPTLQPSREAHKVITTGHSLSWGIEISKLPRGAQHGESKDNPSLLLKGKLVDSPGFGTKASSCR